jgi:hypothetical protein
MGLFGWLYRLPGRINRSMEETALAASVIEGEGGGPQLNTQMVNAALARTEASGSGEEQSDEAEGE